MHTLTNYLLGHEGNLMEKGIEMERTFVNMGCIMSTVEVAESPKGAPDSQS